MESILPNSSAIQALYSNTWEGIVVVDTNHNILMCNNAAAEIFRGNGTEVRLNTDVRQYFQSASVPIYEEAFAQAMKGITTIVERARIVDGKEQWFRHKMSPVYNGNREIKGITLATTDIDAERVAIREKELAEYMLHERIKELKTLYFSHKTLFDEKHSVHEALATIVKVIPNGWQFPDISSARIVFDGIEHLSENYRQPVAVQSAEFTTHDGKSGLLQVSYSEEKPTAYEGPFLKEERELIDNLAAMFSVHYNERAAHTELRKSAANLQTVVESTNVGHLLIDAKYRVVAFNNAMQIGYADGTGVILRQNDDFMKVLSPERSKRLAARLHQIAESRQSVQYDISFERNQNTFHYVLSIHPVIGQNDDIIGYSFSASDITERKTLEVERQRMIEELVHRNKDLEQFAIMVSHNLRAPVANILGLMGLFSYNLTTEEKEKALGAIVTSANRLDEVMTDLNKILQTKRTNTEKKIHIILSELMRETIEGMNGEIQASNAYIDYSFPGDDHLFSIKSYLQNIFISIISNAIKFAKPGERPHLNITAESVGNEITLRFKDQGIGLNMDQFGDQVFGLYKRFHPVVDGKGIGLFMVKNQAEILGGKVRIESQVNNGLEVILVLPR